MLEVIQHEVVQSTFHLFHEMGAFFGPNNWLYCHRYTTIKSSELWLSDFVALVIVSWRLDVADDSNIGVSRCRSTVASRTVTSIGFNGFWALIQVPLEVKHSLRLEG